MVRSPRWWRFDNRPFFDFSWGRELGENACKNAFGLKEKVTRPDETKSSGPIGHMERARSLPASCLVIRRRPGVAVLSPQSQEFRRKIRSLDKTLQSLLFLFYGRRATSSAMGNNHDNLSARTWCGCSIDKTFRTTPTHCQPPQSLRL